jgi:hypothetical protein
VKHAKANMIMDKEYNPLKNVKTNTGAIKNRVELIPDGMNDIMNIFFSKKVENNSKTNGI